MKLRFIPTRVHSVVDQAVRPALAVGGATLALVPQLTGARKRGKKHWVPHLAIGAVEVGLALLAKTETAPKTKAARAAHIAKLVATAKVAKETAKVAKETAKFAKQTAQTAVKVVA